MANRNPSQRTRFQPGNEGRPKGIVDKRSSLRALLDPHAKDLVAKLVELAKGGDTAALRICIDRLIPAPKAKDDPITLTALDGTPSECGDVVVSAVAAGEITPDQGAAVMSILANQVRLVEATELERRIAALEEAAAINGRR